MFFTGHSLTILSDLLAHYESELFSYSSVNEVICHGIPDARPLEDGDIVNIDISVYYKGMHADLNETFCVGTKVKLL